jgi:hypothetical protein
MLTDTCINYSSSSKIMRKCELCGKLHLYKYDRQQIKNYTAASIFRLNSDKTEANILLNDKLKVISDVNYYSLLRELRSYLLDTSISINIKYELMHLISKYKRVTT